MDHFLRHRYFLFISLLIALVGVPYPAFAQEPVIASEIGQVIAEKGVGAANTRFEELMKYDSLDYAVESQGLMVLMTAYMQAGNKEAATAVGEMYGQLMQQMLSGPGGGYPPGMAEAMAEAQKVEEAQNKANEQAERQLRQKQQNQSRGKSRDDLERFVGLYSDPDSNDTRRSIFVTLSCDGYLVTGPMWADVGPWWMRSAADKVFTYSDSGTSLSFEFVGDGGRGTMLNHDVEGAVSLLENKGPLPEGWGGCVERSGR